MKLKNLICYSLKKKTLVIIILPIQKLHENCLVILKINIIFVFVNIKNEVIMNVTRIGEVRGDETAPYIVENYKATTVGEFIEEVLEEFPNEWGYFSFNGSFVGNKNRCEYRYGKLLNNFPNPMVLEEEIYYIKADGGWSRMDYEIYNCE